MSKQIVIKHGWELNKIFAILVQVGIVDVEGENIITVYLTDGSQVVFHSTLRMILLQNRNGRTNFEFGFSYDPDLQEMIKHCVPQLRRFERPKLMELVREKYGESE